MCALRFRFNVEIWGKLVKIVQKGTAPKTKGTILCFSQCTRPVTILSCEGNTFSQQMWFTPNKKSHLTLQTLKTHLDLPSSKH